VASFLQEIKELGLRRWLNENPKIATTIAGLLIGLALLYITVQLMGTCRSAGPGLTEGQVKVWYATEDGKDLIADDAVLVPPFEKNNKKYYRAFVFKCPNGTQWVNHILMYPPEVKRKMEEVRSKSPAPLLEYVEYEQQSLIKRPGTKTWYAFTPRDMDERINAATPRHTDCSGDKAVPVEAPQK
jgi:hypothetical protein